jgi:hypothetical protein
VEVHLEPAGVDGGDRGLQLLRIEIAGAGARRCLAVGVEVGSQHGGREVLADPVLHDLHAGRTEAATPGPGSLGGPVPAFREPVELIDPGAALPPERADHPGREQPAPLGLKVGLEAVGDHRVVADDRGFEALSYETDRREFLGRNGSNRSPRALTEGLSAQQSDAELPESRAQF